MFKALWHGTQSGLLFLWFHACILIWNPKYHKFVELSNWKLHIFKIHITLLVANTVCGCGMITLILNYSILQKYFTFWFNCTCPDLITLAIFIRRSQRHPVMIVKPVEELLSQGIAATIFPASPTLIPVLCCHHTLEFEGKLWLSWKWSPCRNKLFSHLEETWRHGRKIVDEGNKLNFQVLCHLLILPVST